MSNRHSLLVVIMLAIEQHPELAMVLLGMVMPQLLCACACVRADLILSGLDKRDLLSLHRLSCWSLEEARGVSNETGSVYKQPL